MKKCPFCAEDIQDAAIICKHCKQDLRPLAAAMTVACPFCKAVVAKGSKVCPTCGDDISGATQNKDTVPSAGLKKPVNPLVAVFVLLVVLGMFYSMLREPSVSAPNGAATTSRAQTPAPVQEPAKQLALISSRGYESEYGGYRYVEGQVKNISDKPLANVTAVSTWFDKDGNFIKTDQAIVEFNPILPGQTSPFKTITSGNPAMSKYSVEFKELLGGTLATRDDRAVPPAAKPQGAPASQPKPNPSLLSSLIGQSSIVVEERLGPPTSVDGNQWTWNAASGVFRIYLSDSDRVMAVEPEDFDIGAIKP